MFRLLFPLLLAAPALADEPDRPNVLLILTDDQGWGDIRSHGNDRLDTPNLDRLASQGARFDRFFVSPVCAPTRAALLTGRYSLRGGVHGVTRARETLRSEEVTIAELLRDAGYATALFGKWHNGAHWPEDPHGQGFDEFAGFCAGHWNNYFDPLLPHPPEHAPTRPEPALPDGPRRVEGYIADIFTDAALRFVGAEKDAGDPWFCMVSYNTPHWPPQVADDLFDKYRGRGFDAKDAAAYAMVENVDRNVGRLLAALEAWGLADDTVVLFLTDNGPNSGRYNGGMRGAKGSAHEGGVRVPLFVRYPPQIEAGTAVERNAMHVDLLPTLCELCGVAPPTDRELDGRSLVPLLVRNAAGELWGDRRLFTFKNWGAAGRSRDRFAVRTDRWRLVRDGGAGWELFDMTADPGETTDVGDQYSEVRQELADAFAAKWEEVTAGGFEPVPVTVTPDRGVVEFPAHEATLRGDGISYVGPNGWANDWITDWTDPAAVAEWPVRVTGDGRYAGELLYSHAGERPAALAVEWEAGGRTARTEVTLHGGAPAPTFPSPDRFDRGEVFERAWRVEGFALPPLPSGTGTLRLRGLSRAGETFPEVKAVRVRPVAPAAP